MVEVVTQRGNDRPTLVASISPAVGLAVTQGEMGAAVGRLTEGMVDRLAEVVPAYMIPRS